MATSDLAQRKPCIARRHARATAAALLLLVSACAPSESEPVVHGKSTSGSPGSSSAGSGGGSSSSSSAGGGGSDPGPDGGGPPPEVLADIDPLAPTRGTGVHAIVTLTPDDPAWTPHWTWLGPGADITGDVSP